MLDGLPGLCPGDYGSMTFDLIGDANFSSDNKMLGQWDMPKVNLCSIRTNQLATWGELINDQARPQGVNWHAKMPIKSLTADGLEIIALTSDNAWTIYNYVSQDYYNTH